MATVEIVYGNADQQIVLTLSLVSSTTVLEAIQQSGILSLFPDIDLNHKNKVGILGKIVSPQKVIRDHDRIEIYRPLMMDPKEARKRRSTNTKLKNARP